MEFSRQKYWSGLSFPSAGDLLRSGIEPISPTLAGGFFTTEPPGKPTAYSVLRTVLTSFSKKFVLKDLVSHAAGWRAQRHLLNSNSSLKEYAEHA